MTPFNKQQRKGLAAATVLLAACFGWPLIQLAGFALHSELFSYILLIPVISVYLIWTSRKPVELSVRPCWPGAVLLLMAGGALVATYWMGRRAGWAPAKQDYLALMAFSFLLCFWGACLATLGLNTVRQFAFPILFLLFIVPLPVAWLANVDTVLQHTSAGMAEAFFGLVREPALREGLDIHLPGFSLTVAPECSGIHSTMVLLIVSLLAGYLFLRRFWTRSALVLIVIPLAILRNGFRIFVVGELCVHVSPDMIHSYIHEKGGPIFFALSLIPFFLWLVFLRKKDVPAAHAPPVQVPS